jgi:hypothetical protein
MILRFRHKGLERLFRSGDASGVNAQHERRLRQILLALNNATKSGRNEFAGVAAPSIEGRAPRTMGGFGVGQLARGLRVRWPGHDQYRFGRLPLNGAEEMRNHVENA